MNVRIEAGNEDERCQVWLDDMPVQFPDLKSAEAYTIKLEERINAKPRESVVDNTD